MSRKHQVFSGLTAGEHALEEVAVAAPLTDAAIEKIRALILDGGLRPGDRLPPEAELSAMLGVSRSSTREAVRALVTTRVLDVRRGDGTYVTQLTPDLLLTGIGTAVELMQEESILELVECRRIIEPAVTALAASRATEAQKKAIHGELERMRGAEQHEDFVRHDAQFHSAVAHAAGNVALASLLNGISSVSIRFRVWRSMMDADAAQATVGEHEQIWRAIAVGDPERARAAALLHVANVQSWLAGLISEGAKVADPD